MATNGSRAWTPAPAAALQGSDHQASASNKRKSEDDTPPARGITKPLPSPGPIFGKAVFGGPNGAGPLTTPNGTSFASLADQARQQEELYDFRKRLMHALIDIDDSILFDAQGIVEKLVTYRDFCEKVIMVNRELTKALFSNRDAFLATLSAPGLIAVYTKSMAKP